MRIQTRVVVTVIASLAVTVGVTAFVLAQRARDAMLEEAEANGTAIAEVLARNAVFAEQVMPEVEQSLGEQMVVQATLLAHFVEQAEKAGLSPKEINERLKKVTAMTVLNEIWVTDEKGHAYLHNIEDVDFTFSADPKLQPQASEFYPLLTGTAKTVVQRAMKREIDDRVFKYVGVPGQDKPRIVEVGYEATSLSRLREKVGMPRLVADIVTGHNVLGIRVVDKDLNTKACASVLPGVSTTDCSPQERAVLEGVVRSGVARSTLGEQHLTVFVPILAAGGAVEGAAVVDLPAKNLHQALREAWVASGWVVVGVLLAGVLLAVLLSRWIVGPVTLLTSAAAQVQAGRYDAGTLSAVAGRSDELGLLARAFQRMTGNLDSLVGKVRQSSGQVVSAASGIDSAARQQRETANAFEGSAAQISASVRQITGTTNALVKTMEDVAQVAQNAARMAEEGHAGLQHMLDAMKTMADNTAAITEKLALIRTKASGIGVVVVTITKIADQTNLLSLNASIEAEKAGEHGLGFAVVAGEIRRLADQTAVATLDIERMVNDLHTVVTDGVKAVEQFAEVVRQGAADAESVGARQAGIIDAAKTLAPRVETVSQGMHSQAQGAEQINAAMIRLTQGARATASSLQEFAKATGQLRDAVDGLRAEIAAFSVGASDATVARCGK